MQGGSPFCSASPTWFRHAARQVFGPAHHVARMLGDWAIKSRLSQMFDANGFIYGMARKRRIN